MDLNKKLKISYNAFTNTSRLYRLKQIISPLWPICNILEENNHVFKVQKYSKILKYFTSVLYEVCNVDM